MCSEPTTTGGGISAILSRASDKNVSRGRMASTGTEPRQQTSVCGLGLRGLVTLSEISTIDTSTMCPVPRLNYLYANFT